jgi:protein involved in polysaccharide export with SLBB domain
MVRFFYVALLALSTVLFADSSARAQQIPDDLLLQFQKRLQSEESDSSNLLPYPQQLENTQPQSREPFSTSDRTTPSFPKSAIEIYYNDRVKDFIEKEKSDENKKSPYINQIGYDILQKSGRLGSRTSIGPQLMGQISDSYILGVGDQLSITLRGQVNNTYQAVVGRDGHVIIPNQPPLQALGRSFGDFRTDLQSLVSTSMLETQAFVTLKAVRQISVLVSGEVTKPGMVSVNGLSTVIDALIAAEGIRKTGTLRKIQIVRGNETQTLDLYPLLLGIGQAGDISLREGDRIIVPTIGSTIALFSGVSRPGIYEFTGTSISLKSALALAGGPLSSRGVTLIKVSQGSNGLLSLNEYSVTAQINLHRGDLIGSKPVSKRTQGTIYLSGHVYEEGWRPLSTFSSLRTLLNTRGTLREEPYLPVVVIKRPNVNTLMPEFIAVDGAKLLKRGDDFLLQDQDRVIILSLTDIRYLSSEDISLVLQGKMPAYGRTEDLSEALREKSPDDYNSGES